jgi:excisionase family DNA binding protein
VRHHPPDIDELVYPDIGLTPKAAAERLGVDRSTIYRMIKAGSLVSWRVAATQKTRGVPRISSHSVIGYQELQRIHPRETVRQAPREKSESKQMITPAHQAALARLKSLGIV